MKTPFYLTRKSKEIKAAGNGKERKLNKDKSLLNHSRKPFNREGVGILEVIFSEVTDVFFFSLPQMSSLSVYLFVQGITEESLNLVLEHGALMPYGKECKALRYFSC